MPEANLPLIKTDRRGRLCLPRDKRERLMDEFERSGLSGAEFARVVGVKYQTLANWRHQRARKRQAHASSAPAAPQPAQTQPVRWAEASFLAPEQESSPAGLRALAAPALTIRLPGGAQVELSCRSQAEMAAALLRAWEKLAC